VDNQVFLLSELKLIKTIKYKESSISNPMGEVAEELLQNISKRDKKSGVKASHSV
jgi:hypothetical protein